MLFELINLLYALTILIIIQHYYQIKKTYLLILIFHLFAIYLFNGVLFPPSYMPDQFGYLRLAENIRNFDYDNKSNLLLGTTVLIPSIFFGFFPIPFINSIYSIGIINFFLYLFIFLFMYKKGFLTSKPLVYFYLLYPSLLLYSSVALRDMLIFCLMFFGTYLILVYKKSLFGLIAFIPLTFIKFQNFIILILSFFIGLFFSKKTNIKNTLSTLLFIIILFFLFEDYFTLEKINYFRLNFYNENITPLSEPFIPITSYSDLILHSFPSALRFMFRPLPWEEIGIFQILQFIENCSIAILISHIFYYNIKFKLLPTYEVKVLNTMLLIAFVIYGLVIYNSGTAVRYKFPFISVYIIFSYYFIHKYQHLHQRDLS